MKQNILNLLMVAMTSLEFKREATLFARSIFRDKTNNSIE